MNFEGKKRSTNNSPGNQHPVFNRLHWKLYNVVMWGKKMVWNEKISRWKSDRFSIEHSNRISLCFSFVFVFSLNKICFSNVKRSEIDTKWEWEVFVYKYTEKKLCNKSNNTTTQIHHDHLQKQFINRIHWNFIKIQHWFTFPESIRPTASDI